MFNPSPLDLFAMPPTQASVEGGYWVEFQPCAVIRNLSVLEFATSGGGPEYFDLFNAYLKITISVRNQNGD